MVYESKGLLIGEGLDRETLKSMRILVEADPAVERVQHLHTLYLGAHEVLLTIELRFRSTISALEVRQSVARIERVIRMRHADVTRIFFGGGVYQWRRSSRMRPAPDQFQKGARP